VDTVPALRRENRLSTVYLSGEMGDRSVTYAGIDLLFFLHKYRPRGPETELVDFSLFGASYKLADGRELKVNIGGEWELTLEVFRDLMIAMGVAMFLIYFVLVAQFESFSQPLIIMSTIPLSLLGVMPGFLVLNLVQGEYFTATSMIGVIALAGIAVNNSIILLETINALKKEGMELFEALVLSGRMRFRPIILTSVTTILGSMTIVSDPVWSGLAYAIIMGLGMSAALTLMIFPTLYYVVVKD